MDFYLDVIYQEERIHMFGKIDQENNHIEVNFKDASKPSDLLKQMLYQKKQDISVCDLNGKSYSVYGCKFLSSQFSFAGVPVSTVQGCFDRLICEDNVSKLYDTVVFSFSGVEKIFHYDCIKTEYDKGSVILSIPKNEGKEYQISDDLIFSVKSQYDGTIESNELFDLDIKQRKEIKIVSTKPLSVDSLIDLIDRFKQYIELLINQEIQIKDIRFSNLSRPYLESIMICDPILKPKTIIKTIEANSYKETIDSFFSGAKGWFNHYDDYLGTINIWKKTIYNSILDEEDLFIWRCQAFELMCTLNTEILEKANKLKAYKQESPNLKNFIYAVNSIYNFVTIDSDYFKDVKSVRDKLTHNNPKKHVTEIQKKNSYNLIQYFLIKTLEAIMGIEGIPTFLCLQKE